MSVSHHMMMKERVARSELSIMRVIMAWVETLLVLTSVMVTLLCLGDYFLSG